MTADERWARYVAVPALVVSLPIYAVAVAYYWTCREGFGAFLEFAETCTGLRVDGSERETREAA